MNAPPTGTPMVDKSQKDSSAKAPYEKASPMLLARQPAEEPKNKKVPKAAQFADGWVELRQHLEARLNQLRTWRSSWWTQNWADLAEYILPRRSIWLTQSAGGIPSPNNMSRGQPINSAIVDPTATYAVRVCAGGLMSGLASPSRPWFKILPAHMRTTIDAAGRQWLDQVEDVIYTALAGSNFYNSFAQECEDIIVFGTAPSIIYEDEQDGFRCYNPCVGEYYLSSSSTMRVDGLYRTFVMTVSQLVDFFELENCNKEIQDAWRQKGGALDQEYIVAHSIEPNFIVKNSPDSKVPGAFTWRETYWLYGKSTERPLYLRGFLDQPFTAARWTVQSNDAYGRSAGMDVLPDVIQLQVMTRRLAEAVEKMVRPPLLADMQLKNMPSSILPGHVTYVAGLSAGTGMRPIYEVNPDVNHMSQMLEKIEARIKVGFFNDLFLMLETAPTTKMTAYEVAQKIQEKLQVLGPVIEGLIAESLKPKLKRIFAILKRKGMIPPAPDSLKGAPLDIEFVSMLALAQKAAATGGIERIAQFVGNLVAVFPEAKDNLDVDTTIREMNDLLGNPQKILFGPEQVAKTRQANAAAMQKAQSGPVANQSADTMNKGAMAAQVLSQTKVGAGGDALSMILGGGRQQ